MPFLDCSSYSKFGVAEAEDEILGVWNEVGDRTYCVDCGGLLLDFWGEIWELLKGEGWINTIPEENFEILQDFLDGLRPPNIPKKYVLRGKNAWR